MVRETRHLWVGNLPDNIREDRIREHFKRYGRVQNVKLLGRTESGSTVANASGTNSGVCATVAFMDIKSASKAHNAEHVLDERTLTTEYYEPTAIPSAAGAPSAGSSPAGSGYSGSSSSVNSTPAPSSVSRYHLSGGEESTGSACPLAATAAAPANWRGTNDSASEYCRRGNTPAGYSRYQRNNSSAPYSTPPSNVERTTPHHRWYATGDRGGGGGGGATGGESTPSTPGGGTEGGRRRRPSGSGSSRSESSSPEPSDTSRASTPQAPPPTLAHHNNHRTPSTPSHHHQWSSTASGRPLAICVRNLPTRSTDSSLKDGLYHEYKKHGKVVWVKVVGQNADRYAVVRFKKPSDVEKALEVSQDKLFFGCKISVAPHQSCDEDADTAKPYETDIDEYHPKATRTLFIGNLEKDVTQQQLREKFKHFGRIIEIDIKKGSGGGAGYAFCQYASISSVVEAIRAMDGEYVGGSRVKLGFGKPVATTCVWVDGLTEHTEKQVLGAISRCGAATSVCVDRAAGAALVHFEQAAAAGAAVRELRRVAAAAAAAAAAAPAEPEHPRLCVDYASRECQEAFYEQLEKHGGGGSLNGVDRLSGEVAAARYVPAARHEQLRYEGCGSRSRASSYSRASSRTPRYPALDPYDGADYNAERRVYEELGSSPQTEETPFEDRLQSVVVSPHRARRHRRDSSPEDRKHSKERHRSVGGTSVVVGCATAPRRSRSGSRCGERHAGRRRHRRRRDGSGSRAGTPLRDEPDAPPTEPRRPPRDRPPLPMSLPLPKFAVQLLRQAPPPPRPAPAPALAPDSPPRPPSVSSSSGGSAPHSPSLEERIRSLDEKYERWSGGSRAPPPDPPRLKHRLLDVDINEVKPSEVVRSLLAKRSVFDEDSERLEGAVRAPSPVGSPRARVAPLTPRVLRYPFPAHPLPGVATGPAPTVAPAPPDAEAEAPERPADPRLNRPDRPAPLDRCGKYDEIDFRFESRVRPRTPSTDRSQPDSTDRRSPKMEPVPETEPRIPNERRRRDSLLSANKICPDAVVETEAGTPRFDDVEFDYRARDKSKALTSERRQSIGRSQELIAEKTVQISFDRKDVFLKNEDKPSENIANRNDDNNARDLANSFLKRIGSMHEMIKSESFVDKRTKSVDEYRIKSELPAHIDEEIKSTLDLEIKLEELGSQSKKDDETVKEIFTPNHIKKEVIETDTQTHHLNTFVKTKKEIVDINQDLKSNDKNGKERFNQNAILNALHNTNLEKENIEHEKSFKKEISSNAHFFGERKTLENDKAAEERIKSDKSRHIKDRHEKEKHDSERDKAKSSKHDRISDKDRKVKEDHSNDKAHTDKNDKNNKDGEKNHKERCERDTEKSKHEEKSIRHEHHRREKLDKRKDSTDGDGKGKKEDKSKHDRKKDSSDSKRDSKKDGESSKSRKSSRDESSRDMCRKDSTDSSTSRASHDSTKLKDIDINEIKEESKPKVKHYLEINCKQEIDKDFPTKCLDSTKFEPLTKIKTEIKEEKDLTEQHTKVRIEHSLDHAIKIKDIEKQVKIEQSLDHAIKIKDIEKQVKIEHSLDHAIKIKDIEKQRHYSLDSPSVVESKRKERLNSCSSLPSNIGHKRRMSSQDSIESLNEDIKKLRNEGKSTDRKESKDSRSTERHKTTKFNKGHFAKLIESKTKDDKKNQVKPPDDTFELKDNEIKDPKPCSTDILYDKQKPKQSNPTENDEKSPQHLESQNDGLHNDIDFLATLELRSSEEDEKQKALRKEMKEKKRIQQLQQIHELQMQQDALQQAELLNKNKDDKKIKTTDEKKKEAARDKRLSIDRKSRDEKIDNSKRKNRKNAQSSGDTSDSDEPKKHSIFDIIDDGPTYISMYDKVKARSCKNMQKQEEEKRQEKIKAKFSQLKQSRAKREEKKRSSWDEDSDSDHDRKKVQKGSMDSSTDDDAAMYNKKREKHGSSPEYRTNEYFNVPNEEDLHNKLSRKNSRSRIISDTSDDDASKRSISKSPNFVSEHKRELALLSVMSLNKTRDDACLMKESCEDKIKKNSLLNLFGKSDSDDSKLKSSLETDNEYKPLFSKNIPHDFSSESESTMCNRNIIEIRKKHKKKQKKHKTSVSDGENKTEIDTAGHDGEIKHKISEKVRRHSNKKEKRKDKIRDSVDADDNRDEKNKCKRDKKLMTSSFDGGPDSISKKDGKMEDIFGPLSDESDRETRIPQKHDFHSHDYEPSLSTNEQIVCDDSKFKDKEELKRRKERRRKERRYLTKDDDNSLDVDAVSKAIEARLFAESITDEENRAGIDMLHEHVKRIEQNELKRVDDTYLTDTYKGDKHSDRVKKDCREKRKKKKKNREDRQSRKDHHHFYHHDRSDKIEPPEPPVLEISTKEFLLDIPLPSDTPAMNVTDKSDDSKSLSESPSLPRLTDSPPAETQQNAEVKSEKKSPCLGSDVSMEIDYLETKQVEVYDIPMPPPLESIDISKVPLPADPPTEAPPNRESLPSTFNDDIGNSESAVRSISNLPIEIEKPNDKGESPPPPCKVDKKLEEKPRAIISQEETEDAVAALLGESFGGKVAFTDYEQVENDSTHQSEMESASTGTENILEEDAEEMRRAVQNLNASELEIKPDTPVSDNDLLLIDTDTEEADETPQDAIDRLPVSIIATNQSITVSTKQSKPTDISNIVIAKPKPTVVQVITTDANESIRKINDQEQKILHTPRENVQVITSTATPVITSWTLTNNKIEPHMVNIQTNPMLHRDKNENKHTHITANIVQIRSPNQSVTGNNALRPIINPSRVGGAPYQVINQMIRPQSPIMQPPTIKIPEPHILYQKPSGIVISPRLQTTDPRLQSPKPISQGESMTSPRLSNMTILSTSPQNLNSVGLPSPNALQRSPGQVTVVRMQQPPLSPIQAMHLPHGARTMVSPNIPNSVLVQTQGAPIHFNRLPVTPVLAPISKQIAVNNVVHQNKTIAVSVSPTMHQKTVTGEMRKSEQRPGMDGTNENSKIILSPTSMPQTTNPTVMAQNRLITMQHAVHVGNMNSTLHLGNKVLLNNLCQLNDRRDNQVQKSEQLSHIPFGTTPIIHVAGVNHSSAPLIQSGNKPVILQEANAVRSQGSNVIHSLNSQRLLTTAPITNVIQIDPNKAPPSVLSMATIRPPTVLTKLDTSKSIAVTTNCLTNVVMTPVLLKTSSNPGTIILNSKSNDSTENHTGPNHISRDTENKMSEKHDNKVFPVSPSFLYDSKEKNKCYKPSNSPVETVTKCETDFEELLKDTTNEIKVTNDPEKKLEVNVGKKVTLMSVSSGDKKLNSDGPKKDDFEKDNKVSEQPVIDMAFLHSNVEQNKSKNSQINKENRETFVGSEKISDIVSDPKLGSDLSKSETVHKDSSPNIICNEDEKESGKSCKIHKENIFALEVNESESNDNPLKNLDENDSWSAKDVNIDSVIKKVDSLCSDSNEATEKKEDKIENEALQSEHTIEPNFPTNNLPSNPESINPEPVKPAENSNDILMETSGPEDDSSPLKVMATGKRGGRSGRGKRTEKSDRVQTRQISKPARGATSSRRGRGRGKVDKKVKSVVNSNASNMPGDVYDFHEDSGDETNSPNKAEARPRLILTIKSPILGNNNSCPTSTLSITQKEHGKILEKTEKEEKPEDFISPSLNTRKSRRLQEKDVQKTTTDDSVDEFGKGPVTKSGKRRATRQAGAKSNQAAGNEPRKPARGVKRGRDRSLSDASIDSGDEKTRRDETTRDAKAPRLSEPTINVKLDTDPPVTSAPIARPTPPVIQPVLVQSVATPTSVVQSTPQPTVVQPVISQPTPIMKPPKKMISEISAKLAGAFEAAVVSSVRMPIPCVAQQPPIQPMQRAQVAETVLEKGPAREPSLEEFRAEPHGDALARRLVDNVPGSMMPVGATEATDARVQSPALPHRPPSTHRPADRVTPILIRGGDGEGALVAGGAGVGMGAAGAGAGAVAVAGAGGSRFRGAYAGPASLPRGAHHPHHHPHVKQVAVVGPHHYSGAAPRVTLTSVPAVSPQGQIGLGDGMYPHFSHQHYQVYQQHFRATQHENRASPSPYTRSLEAEGCEAPAPPLELRRPASARVPRPAHSPAPSDRLIMYAVGCGRSPPPAHGTSRLPGALPPLAAPGPPHASQVPREADSLQMLLRRYPVMWQGLLALKNDSAAVQMHFVGGNHAVAGDTLPRLADGSAPLLRIAQRMRLEPAQLDQVHRKMKMENEHCMLLALPCGRDHMDVLQQSTNLTHGFITYLQRKQAAGIVNIAPPGHHQALYTVHIFPSCDFANENLNRIAPDLMHRVADIAHLLIVIATV